MTPTIFISAGEASGEAYGALLIDELKSRLAVIGQQAIFFGMGGPRMAAAGLERVVRAEDMAVMGITEVVRHLPRIYREFRKLKQSIRDRRPSIAILIDFPDIHFKLAEEFHRLGVPVIFFVSPQLWAWKKHRIKLVQRNVDQMLVIFPFEEPFYRERGVQAEFVGHPLAELPAPTISREEYALQAASVPQNHWIRPKDVRGRPTREPNLPGYGLDPKRDWIALLPGSRATEIMRNLPGMLKAANLLGSDYEYLIPVAPTVTPKQIRAIEYRLGRLLAHKTSSPRNIASTTPAPPSTTLAPPSWPPAPPPSKPPSSAIPLSSSTAFLPSPTPSPNVSSPSPTWPWPTSSPKSASLQS